MFDSWVIKNFYDHLSECMCSMIESLAITSPATCSCVAFFQVGYRPRSSSCCPPEWDRPSREIAFFVMPFLPPAPFFPCFSSCLSFCFPVSLSVCLSMSFLICLLFCISLIVILLFRWAACGPKLWGCARNWLDATTHCWRKSKYSFLPAFSCTVL